MFTARNIRMSIERTTAHPRTPTLFLLIARPCTVRNIDANNKYAKGRDATIESISSTNTYRVSGKTRGLIKTSKPLNTRSLKKSHMSLSA